jgi:hypothetical protein
VNLISKEIDREKDRPRGNFEGDASEEAIKERLVSEGVIAGGAI